MRAGGTCVKDGARGASSPPEACAAPSRPNVAAPARWGLDLGRPDERLRETAYAATVLRTLQRTGPVDVVHDHCGGPMLLGATVLRPAPVVHTVHGFISEAAPTPISAGKHCRSGPTRLMIAIGASRARAM